MTLSTITMKKFIKDINNNNIPKQLEDIYQKIRIESIYNNRDIKTLITIPVFRRLFTPNDLTRIITHYRHKDTSKQTKINL